MNQPGTEREIGTSRGGDRRNPERIALDGDGSAETGTGVLAIDRRQGSAQQQVKADPCRDDEQQEPDRDALEDLQSNATLRISMEFVPPSTPDSSPLVRMT